MQRSASRATNWNFVFPLIGLLAMPAAALIKLAAAVPATAIVGAAASINIVTFLVYYFDKKRAAAEEWRISERTLHLFSLIGGWPMAFAAQRLFRHKNIKTGFQVTFWTTVLAYQLLSFGYLTNWTWTLPR